MGERRGRPKIDREIEALRSRLAAINAGLLACYETIAIGQRKKAAIEEKISLRQSARPQPPSTAGGK